MRIKKLKQALQEISYICFRTQYCADCPFYGENGYAMCDNGEPVISPANWSLDWHKDVGGVGK